MRTTVDLPAALHQRAVALARQRGTSLSAVVADLAARGLGQLGEPLEVTTDATSGFPVISVGRRVTFDEIAQALADE
ncbi:hypothetical protein G9U51_10645 [Calidifontibacter sp. DB0510]|uniref:Antitoxin n=1 Tax=Metallococcus carri TaxID=1656884 RepID=A0A967B606_9MICO|nr:hypothetical protein [Metallococcus carri]NHN56232.1 hypothetical protein [Metallococcus carri]NOP38716.1 hypothetical protein [Calidifontibacter sp. DB2511S]